MTYTVQDPFVAPGCSDGRGHRFCQADSVTIVAGDGAGWGLGTAIGGAGS